MILNWNYIAEGVCGLAWYLIRAGVVAVLQLGCIAVNVVAL